MKPFTRVLSAFAVGILLQGGVYLYLDQYMFAPTTDFNVAGASSDGSIGEDHGPETHLIPNILKSAISGDGNFTIFGDDYDRL